MHLYIATRGIKNKVDQFITELQGKYFPFKYPNEKGELQDCMLQCAVRPIQLWEICFPESEKDAVLNTFFKGNENNGLQHNKHKKFVWMIRKALGVDKIPEYKKDRMIPITLQDMELIGIGIKEDYWVDTKTGKRIFKPTEEQKKEAWEGI